MNPDLAAQKALYQTTDPFAYIEYNPASKRVLVEEANSGHDENLRFIGLNKDLGWIEFTVSSNSGRLERCLDFDSVQAGTEIDILDPNLGILASEYESGLENVHLHKGDLVAHSNYGLCRVEKYIKVYSSYALITVSSLGDLIIRNVRASTLHPVMLGSPYSKIESPDITDADDLPKCNNSLANVNKPSANEIPEHTEQPIDPDETNGDKLELNVENSVPPTPNPASALNSLKPEAPDKINQGSVAPDIVQPLLQVEKCKDRTCRLNPPKKRTPEVIPNRNTHSTEESFEDFLKYLLSARYTYVHNAIKKILISPNGEEICRSAIEPFVGILESVVENFKERPKLKRADELINLCCRSIDLILVSISNSEKLEPMSADTLNGIKEIKFNELIDRYVENVDNSHPRRRQVARAAYSFIYDIYSKNFTSPKRIQDEINKLCDFIDAVAADEKCKRLNSNQIFEVIKAMFQ